MRVLVVHNRYRSEMPSGENRVVDDEVQLLRDHGLDVETYIRSSDEIANFGRLEKLGLAVRPIFSREDVRSFTALLAKFRPDVVHLHNPFPLISPWVVRVAKGAGVPVVQTVHNYRYSCPSGTLFRDGKVCTACHGKKTPWPSVAHGCYRDSRAQSAVMATAARMHRPTRDAIDQFLPVSEFVATKLVEAGIAIDRITVKPNFVTDPGRPGPIGVGFLFAGRVDEAKGIRLLLDAWKVAGIGFKRFEHYRLRVLLHTGGITSPNRPAPPDPEPTLPTQARRAANLGNEVISGHDIAGCEMRQATLDEVSDLAPAGLAYGNARFATAADTQEFAVPSREFKGGIAPR